MEVQQDVFGDEDFDTLTAFPAASNLLLDGWSPKRWDEAGGLVSTDTGWCIQYSQALRRWTKLGDKRMYCEAGHCSFSMAYNGVPIVPKIRLRDVPNPIGHGGQFLSDNDRFSKCLSAFCEELSPDGAENFARGEVCDLARFVASARRAAGELGLFSTRDPELPVDELERDPFGRMVVAEMRKPL